MAFDRWLPIWMRKDWMTAVIPSDRLHELRRREDAAFAQRTPKSAQMRVRASRHLPHGVPMSWMASLYRTPTIYVDSGAGAEFTDLDGNRYLDFNVCDLSMTMGFGAPAIAAAVARQARAGCSFLLPGEAAVSVAEKLAERTGMPKWQMTLSASGANSEVLRIARLATRRSRVIVFGGHYHGHIEETLLAEHAPRTLIDAFGLNPAVSRETLVLPFNDPAALERALAAREVALVLTEPALTNCNLVLPDPGYLAAVRELTRRTGTLLCIDEAHTFQFAYGGLTRQWRLEPDFLVLGKGLGSGVSAGLYAMTEELGRFFDEHFDVDVGPRGIPTGGTTYASALTVSALEAALESVLTEEAYARVTALGARLADGLEEIFQRRALPWRAFRCGPRSGYCLAPELPRNGREAAASLDYELIDTRRVFMANRGIWDAVASAGPQVSFAHEAHDIDRYLEAADEFLGALLGDSQRATAGG